MCQVSPAITSDKKSNMIQANFTPGFQKRFKHLVDGPIGDVAKLKVRFFRNLPESSSPRAQATVQNE